MEFAICAHPRLQAKFADYSVNSAATGARVGMAVSLMVRCDQCGLPFQFDPLPLDRGIAYAQLNADSTEIRVRVAPAPDARAWPEPVAGETR